VSTLTTRLRDIESQLRVGAEEFQQQVQATLLTAEDLAEASCRAHWNRI
jgi:predicted ATP-dependent protease